MTAQPAPKAVFVQPATLTLFWRLFRQGPKSSCYRVFVTGRGTVAPKCDLRALGVCVRPVSDWLLTSRMWAALSTYGLGVLLSSVTAIRWGDIGWCFRSATSFQIANRPSLSARYRAAGMR